MSNMDYMDLAGRIVLTGIVPFVLICHQIGCLKRMIPSVLLFGRDRDLSKIGDSLKYIRACAYVEFATAVILLLFLVWSACNAVIGTLFAVIANVIGVLLNRWISDKLVDIFSVVDKESEAVHTDPKKEPSAFQTLPNQLKDLIGSKRDSGTASGAEEKTDFASDTYRIINDPIFDTWTRTVKSVLSPLLRRVKRPAFQVPEKYYWLCCLGIASVAFGVGFLIYGGWDVFDMLVDVPGYSYLVFIQEIPGMYYIYYLGLSAGATMAVVALLRFFLLGDKEYRFLSLNGFFSWLMLLLITTLFSALANDILKEVYVYLDPYGANFLLYCVFMLIFATCICFAFSDSMTGLITVMISMPVYRCFVTSPVYGVLEAIFPVPLAMPLLVTYALRLLVDILERLKIMEGILWIINKLCTPKYFFCLTLIGGLVALLVMFFR